MALVATDGTRIYAANVGSGWDTTSATFVTSLLCSDNSAAAFSSGTSVTVTNGATFSAVDVHQKNSGAWDDAYNQAHRASGLAVQASGDCLAVSNATDGVVRLFHKTTGASFGVGTLSVAGAGALAFDSAGSLIAVENGALVRFTSISSSSSATDWVSVDIAAVTDAIGVACDPSSDVILVARGGTTQQVQAFDHTGAHLWDYGTLGGYDVNGPTVTNAMFGFGSNQVPLAIPADHSFWIGDGYTNRLLHVKATHNGLVAAPNDQIAYSPSDYVASVDENSSGTIRVFHGFLEYAWDLTKPMIDDGGANGSWTLVKCWQAGLGNNNKFIQHAGSYWWDYTGLACVETLSNSKTYALVKDWTSDSQSYFSVVELTSTGIRETGTQLPSYTDSLYKDGSVRRVVISGGMQTLSQKALSGFDGSNNPTWGSFSTIATTTTALGQNAAYAGQNVSNAQGLAGPRIPEIGTTYFTLNASTAANLDDAGTWNSTGFHIGGVASGASSFLWQSSPGGYSRPFVDDGTFMFGFIYSCGGLTALGSSVIYSFRGELGSLVAEASQHMHFWKDGLFVGQFGTPSDVVIAGGGFTPGFAGNQLNPWQISSGFENYYITAPESQVGGLMVWHLGNSSDVRELSASGALGSSLTLTDGGASWSTAVTATPSSGQVVLAWTNPGSATSNKVYRSTVDGYRGTVLHTGLGTTYTDSTPTNGTVYYYTVGSTAGVSPEQYSEQIKVLPFDTSVHVMNAGYCDAGIDPGNGNYTIHPINSTALYPWLMPQSTNLLGTMMQTRVGSGGGKIFSYPTAGTDLTLSGAATVTLAMGWYDYGSAKTSFRVNGIEPTPASASHFYTKAAFPNGSFGSGADVTCTIDPGDTGWHLMTVVCPVIDQDARSFSLVVTPFGSGSPAATQTFSQTLGTEITAQFYIKGKVTLTIPAGAVDGTLGSVFVDPAVIG